MRSVTIFEARSKKPWFCLLAFDLMVSPMKSGMGCRRSPFPLKAMKSIILKKYHRISLTSGAIRPLPIQFCLRSPGAETSVGVD